MNQLYTIFAVSKEFPRGGGQKKTVTKLIDTYYKLAFVLFYFMKLTNKCMSLIKISIEEFQIINQLKLYRDWVNEPSDILFQLKHCLRLRILSQPPNIHVILSPHEHLRTYGCRSHQLCPSGFKVAVTNLAEVLAVSIFC